MAFPLRELIAPATGAVTSVEFIIGKGPGSQGQSRPVTLVASNLAGAEDVDIQIKTGDPANEWIDLYEGGSQVQLTLTNNVEVLNAPGIFRVIKNITAGNCGVYIATPAAPGDI